VTLVVVGASIAGVSAASTARKLGYPGRVVVLGAEPHLPYDRPPLSKQVLSGAWEVNRIALRQPGSYAAEGIELTLGRTATKLLRDDQAIELDGSELLAFDELVIATGVRPAIISGTEELDNVHYLRTIDDALSLRRSLERGGPLVIIGGGFLGTEVAAVACTAGVEVIVIDTLSQPLGRALGDWVGGRIRELHESRGVTFRLGTGVEEIVAAGSRAVDVRLTDGTTVAAGAVLVAIGSRPNVEWLDGSGVATSGGVACDQYCQVSPAIAAAGDVASWHHPRVGTQVRLEHRMNAQEHAIAAVTNLLLPADERSAFSPVSYFWSDQYDVRLQAYGSMPPASMVALASGDPAEGRFTVTYRLDGRLVGAVGWNSPRQMRSYRDLIAAESPDAATEVPVPAG
jgi:3-phenylpropionate/trans-cinnamate dioxygenase ferredoxin reductase component